METLILAVLLAGRENYVQVHQHINPKSYSREFQIVLGFIKAYYERDTEAKAVDRTVIGEIISAEVQNDKHVDRFVSMIDEALEADVSEQNVKHVILSAKQREKANELAIAIANDKEHMELLEEYREIKLLATLDELLEKGVEVYEGDTLDDLLEHEADTSDRLIVYPLSLNERLDGGLRGSDHLVIYGRPEMAKTALVLTMACGFAKQGKRGIVFNNEERIERLRMRALSCSTGMTAAEIRADPERAKALAAENGYHNIIFISLSPGTLGQVEAFVKKYEATWFIGDQIRNYAMKSENRTNQLEAAAIGQRNIGKKYNAVAISITQAGDSAEGKSILEMGDVDSSNTGIPGACDVLLGIGATAEQKALGIRVLSLSKNKIGGVHDNFPVRFNQWISKYVSYKEAH